MAVKTPLVWKDGKAKLDGKLAFEFMQNYGIPPQLLAEEFDRICPPQSKLRMQYIAQAYDDAHGTDYVSKI